MSPVDASSSVLYAPWRGLQFRAVAARMFHGDERLTRQQLGRVAGAGVDVFLAAYATPRRY